MRGRGDCPWMDSNGPALAFVVGEAPGKTHCRTHCRRCVLDHQGPCIRDPEAGKLARKEGGKTGTETCSTSHIAQECCVRRHPGQQDPGPLWILHMHLHSQSSPDRVPDLRVLPGLPGLPGLWGGDHGRKPPRAREGEGRGRGREEKYSCQSSAHRTHANVMQLTRLPLVRCPDCPVSGYTRGRQQPGKAW